MTSPTTPAGSTLHHSPANLFMFGFRGGGWLHIILDHLLTSFIWCCKHSASVELPDVLVAATGGSEIWVRCELGK